MDSAEAGTEWNISYRQTTSNRKSPLKRSLNGAPYGVVPIHRLDETHQVLVTHEHDIAEYAHRVIHIKEWRDRGDEMQR